MNKEIEYTNHTDSAHIRSYGQYFTRAEVADFMCAWACQGARTVLDSAAGNSVFLQAVKKRYPHCRLFGYEIDPEILSFFGNPSKAQIRNADYLLNEWDHQYDAIVCNPPYGRFQSVSNRETVLQSIREHTGIKYSAYTNLYILFLIKSIFQMSEKGRLAYLIPTEFLNSAYGIPIKKKLLEEQLLRAIINFENDDEMFLHATTTCCILLLDREKKDRGIATGANDFFCLSKSKIEQNRIPDSAVMRCICRSADVGKPVFKEEDFHHLAETDKNVYLLDTTGEQTKEVAAYIAKGQAEGIDQKYLPSRRHPWYSMEHKPAAPIWVSSACRNGIKFVRNLANVHTLTTFHSVYVNEAYEKDVNVIFCYFLTPIAQSIIRESRKELGNGLEKFQPGDLNHAKMLDISVLQEDDYQRITDIYEEMTAHYEPGQIDRLSKIFSPYLLR